MAGKILACIAFVVALSLLTLRPFILDKIALPLAITFYSADGMITQDGIDHLHTMLTILAALSLLLGCFVLGYSTAWRYCSTHLPRGYSSDCVFPMLSVSAFELYSLAAIFLGAIVLRLHGITRGLNHDEIFTAMHFVDVDSVWKTISSYIIFNNHIAYSVLARFSQSLLGRSEWTLRLPALVLGLSSLYACWLFTRGLLGPMLALVATLGLATSPPHVEWSVSARGYSGMLFSTLISSYLYLTLLRYPSYSASILFIVTSVMGIYFHLYAILMTMVQTLFLSYLAARQLFGIGSKPSLSRESFRLLWVSFGIILVLALACYAPVFPELISTIVMRGHGQFQAAFPFNVIGELSGSTRWPLAAVVFPVCALGWISLRRSYANEVTYFSLLFLLPLFAMWLSRPFDLYPRFFVYFLPYYMLFLVSGLFMLWRLSTRGTITVHTYVTRPLCAILALSIFYIWAVTSWNMISSTTEDGFKKAAAAMEIDKGEASTLWAIGGDPTILQYYVKRKLLIPHSFREFQEAIKGASEVRCAYLTPSWAPAEHRAIAEFLSQHAEVQQFGEVLVFTYRK
jgi:Dolichyl-phosphate-mannose-protein mannosyltransferase